MRISLLLLPWCTTAANELLDTTAKADDQPNVIDDENTPAELIMSITTSSDVTRKEAKAENLPSSEATPVAAPTPVGGDLSTAAAEAPLAEKSAPAEESAPAEAAAPAQEAAAPAQEAAAPAREAASTQEAPLADKSASADEPEGDVVAVASQIYSYEGDDYPGADEGILVALPQRASGPIEPLELEMITEPADADGETGTGSVSYAPKVWSETPELIPHYEWMIAQARGNRFALPEPFVQLLEQLERAMQSFEISNLREVPVERRRLQLDSLLNLLSATNSGYSLLSAGGESGLAFDAHQFPGLINTISGSVANVVQAAGEAVGVTTTTAKPVSQAVLGMLSILQGFQKLAEAAGSMGLQFKVTE